jgi:hypothetical protein
MIPFLRSLYDSVVCGNISTILIHLCFKGLQHAVHSMLALLVKNIVLSVSYILH